MKTRAGENGPHHHHCDGGKDGACERKRREQRRARRRQAGETVLFCTSKVKVEYPRSFLCFPIDGFLLLVAVFEEIIIIMDVLIETRSERETKKKRTSLRWRPSYWHRSPWKSVSYMPPSPRTRIHEQRHKQKNEGDFDSRHGVHTDCQE